MTYMAVCCCCFSSLCSEHGQVMWVCTGYRHRTSLWSEPQPLCTRRLESWESIPDKHCTRMGGLFPFVVSAGGELNLE